ncbi:FAD binding domain-containing protein [Pseudonocardia thermophila]|uniref:FAD binding domain-containing protein n=1 Tax=Pseudonocardia thermophila TaxID=1848 RepID=UPI00248ECCC3|nr:xanthine dehydrogenase family protein subunit M [Pseudonocardia thermophila]
MEMELRTVDSLDAALDVLADRGADCQVLAGGTDVMIQLARGEIAPAVLLHVENVPELQGVSANGATRIGSLVTHRALAKGLLGPRYRALAEAAGTVGGLQTQSVGTLGGNVCNASPAADTLPALLVHDAQVALRGRAGSRTVPLEEFVVGRRATTRRPDELLTEIVLATPPECTGDVYLKVGRRSAMEVAIVGLAMRLTFDGDDVTDARIALAAVGPRPLRSPAAEAALIGSRLEPRAIETAVDAVLRDISPIDDLRGSADYRRRVVPGLLERAAGICAQRAGRTPEHEE